MKKSNCTFILFALIATSLAQSSQSVDEKNQKTIDKYDTLVARSKELNSKYHNGASLDDSIALSKDKEYQEINLEMQKIGPLFQEAREYQIAHGTGALSEMEKQNGANKMTDEVMSEFVAIVKNLKVNKDTKDDVSSKLNKYNMNSKVESSIIIYFQRGGYNLKTGLPQQDICSGMFGFDDLKKLTSIIITSNGKAIYTKSNHP